MGKLSANEEMEVPNFSGSGGKTGWAPWTAERKESVAWRCRHSGQRKAPKVAEERHFTSSHQPPLLFSLFSPFSCPIQPSEITTQVLLVLLQKKKRWSLTSRQSIFISTAPEFTSITDKQVLLASGERDHSFLPFFV